MTSRQAQPELLRMTAPLVVSFWMRAAVTFVDTIYASWIGDAAVAAVGLTIPLEFLMIAVWVGLSTGLTSGLARAMGAGAHARVDQYVRVGWRMIWTVAPLFTLVGAAVWLGANRLGLDPAVAAGLRVYGTVLIGGSAFTVFWSVLPDSLVKAHQDTRATMWAGICTNVLNVGLNTLFLFAFHWGLFGIALSTVLGRIGGLAFALWCASRHEARRRAAADAGAGVLDPSPYASVLRLAVPSALTFGLMATETAVVNMLLARRPQATEAIAAYSIYYRFALLGLQPVIACGVAMLPFASRRLARGDAAGVRRGLGQASAAATAYALGVLGPLMLAAGAPLAASLTESPVTERLAAFGLRLVPLACLAGAGFLLCRPVFEAAQRGTPGLVMAGLRYLGLNVPLVWCGIRLAEASALPGMYGAVVGTLVASGLASLVFYPWALVDLRQPTTIDP